MTTHAQASLPSGLLNQDTDKFKLSDKVKQNSRETKSLTSISMESATKAVIKALSY